MKNQRTLLIFAPSIEDGGVEKNLYNLTNFLVGKLSNISIITVNRNKKKKFKKGINFISPKSNLWINSNRIIKTFISIILFIIFLLKEKNKITIFSFNSNVYAILLAKLFNCKIIIRSNASPQGYSERFVKKKIFSLLFNLSDQVIVNSLDFKKQVKKILNVNSICIYNPLEDSTFINKKAKKKIKFKFFRSNCLNIISVGRLVKQKNHITILKAANILKNKLNFKLLIMGDGEEKNNLFKFIENNKLKKNVKIIGFKKNPYPYINKSNIFVLSSLYEGLPNVLLEALSMKKFVISSDCYAGPKEILKKGKYGELFKVKDYKQLSKKIEFYYFNKKKLQKKTLLGFKSLERFDYENKCKLYLKVIKKYL